MEIRVLFFGALADVAGTSFKNYNDIKSFGDLRLRIEDDYPGITNYSYRVIINRILAENEPVLNDGDEVALLPKFYSE